MIISTMLNIIDLRSVFRCCNGKHDMYFIKSHENFADGRLTIFEVVPVIDWEPQYDKSQKINQYSFLEGSGFDGGPLFKEVQLYKHIDGAIYREIEF